MKIKFLNVLGLFPSLGLTSHGILYYLCSFDLSKSFFIIYFVNTYLFSILIKTVFVNIYIFWIFFSMVFAKIYIFPMFFSKEFVQWIAWGYPTLHISWFINFKKRIFIFRFRLIFIFNKNEHQRSKFFTNNEKFSLILWHHKQAQWFAYFSTLLLGSYISLWPIIQKLAIVSNLRLNHIQIWYFWVNML